MLLAEDPAAPAEPPRQGDRRAPVGLQGGPRAAVRELVPCRPVHGRRPRGPRARAARPRLAEHRRRDLTRSPTCAAASCCSTSGRSAASTACTSSTSCARSRRSTPTSSSSSACTRRSSCTRPTRTRCAAAVERYDVAAPGPRRPRAGHLAGLHRPRLADAGARRPGGLRRRAVRRRGPRPRHRRAARRAASPEHRAQGHAAAGRLAVRRARRCSPVTCGSRPRRSPCPDGTFLVADAGHHSLVELAADAETVVRRIGSGERGLVDGAAQDARFNEPNGLCLLPDDVAAEVGYDVVVADTVNHALRGRPAGRRRRSRPWPATASSWMPGDGTDRAVEPVGRGLVAGPGLGGDGRRAPALDVRPAHRRDRGRRRHHQRGAARRAARRGVVRADVGAGARPGTGCGSRTARPRACATSRTAAVHTVRRHRAVRLRLPATASRRTALLQHPLGVTVLPDGSVAVCDTYNGAVRRWIADGSRDHASRPGWRSRAARSSTGDHLLVVESAAHRLTRVPLAGVGAGRRLRAHAPSGR